MGGLTLDEVRALRELGVSAVAQVLLLVLRAHDGQEIGLRQVGKYIEVVRATLICAAERLDALGLITKRFEGRGYLLAATGRRLASC
jgi:hypothetical protein